MWRERVLSLDADATFAEGADPASIAEVEKSLGVRLPDSLKSLLIEADGVRGLHGDQLMWSTATIRNENAQARTNQAYHDHYMPLDHSIFFSDAGNGELFGFGVVQGAIRNEDVQCGIKRMIAGHGSLRRYAYFWSGG